MIENANSSPGLSLQRQILEFKANQNIWLNIQIATKDDEATLILKDLIVCEYKYKVIPHFIFYPRLSVGQFISLNTVGFGNLIDRCSSWDKRSPVFEKNEITMLDDLTHNDVVVRQINASSTLKRLLDERLTQPQTNQQASEPFNFPLDFYSDSKYWLKANVTMKVTMMAFLVMYVP